MTTHVAGVPLAVPDGPGARLRQRCAWCGALLVEVTRQLVMDTADLEGLRFWAVHTVVQVGADGTPHGAGELFDPVRVPADSCVALDPAVTI